MSNLYSLPEVVFVNANKDQVEATILAQYEAITGRTLTKGDPVRLFLLTIANIIILEMNAINETGKQNLLRYASGNNLNHIGALIGVERIPPAAATTTMEITLSEALAHNVTIPAGTRFTADGAIFFALDTTMVITTGQVSGTGRATCTVIGDAGNGYAIGQIKTLVDPVAYVTRVRNITPADGGADVESDDSFREAIRIAPESFSVAGPAGAYEYHAKRASSLIVDVTVLSPTPGDVAVRILLQGGELPTTEIINTVNTALNANNVRPLTDHVSVLAPTAVNYNIDLTYYIDRKDVSQEAIIRRSVQAAVNDFVLWQKEKIGRDINPSELIRRVVAAGAKRVDVRSPSFITLDFTQVAQEGTVNAEYGGEEDA